MVGTLLDESIRIPVIGYRIGLDPILGILPVAGDAVAAAASLYIVFVGMRLGVPVKTLVKMLAFVAIEFVIGSIPVLGTVLDAFLKVNMRNVATIESHVSGQ
jgi:hypothetical protein